MNKFVILLLLFAGAAAVQFGPEQWRKYRVADRSVKAHAFDHLSTHLAGDLALLQAAMEGNRNMPEQPSVTGLPLLFFLGGNENLNNGPYRFGASPEISLLMHELPESLIAKSPAEVGTLIGLRWTDLEAGIWVSGAARNMPDNGASGQSAMMDVCEIVVVDKQSGRLIATATARGEVPKFDTVPSESNETYGPRCDPQILDYIRSLFVQGRTANADTSTGKRVILPPGVQWKKH